MRRLIMINILLLFLLQIFPKQEIKVEEVAVSSPVEQVQTISSRSLDEPRTSTGSDEDVEKVTKYSDKLVEYVKKKETFQSSAYKAHDSEEYYTIGYGIHNSSIKSTDTISEETANRLLIAELDGDCEYVLKYMSYLDEDLTQGELDALTDFVFNLGTGWLQTLTANKTRTKEEISNHITAYTKCNGVELNGLVTRRNEELNMFMGGEY